MTTQEETPTHIQNLATQRAALTQTALLGIFGSDGNRQALVRLPHGGTRTIGVGSRIAGSTVAAIAEDAVVLSRNGAERILRMPRSSGS